MKCLTIRQPHLARLIAGTKLAEFRRWTTSYRGPIALHAARGVDAGATDDMPRGAVVATARLVSIVLVTRQNVETFSTSVERATIGEYAWLFENIVTLSEPVRVSGQLGLWTWHESTEPRQMTLY